MRRVTAPCITEARLRALRENRLKVGACELRAMVDLSLAAIRVARHLPDLPLYEAGPEATDAIDELLSLVP